jgi:3'-phosphoadenosine 5'-phosphosulfate (PAPS) 3'-phosphatase
MQKVVELRSRSDFKIYTKGDESPVTSADFWANEFILDAMAKLFPGEHLIGEESEDKSYAPGIDTLWYIDPIDGTKNYISGNNPFHILIGLCVDGEPTIGICAYPTNGDIIVGGSNYQARIWRANGTETAMNKAQEWSTAKSHPITLKGFSEQARTRVYGKSGLRKADHVYRHPTMMGLVFGISSGYMDHRRIHWWDLCGPAAIMRSLGYEVGKTFDNTCSMNDGSLNTDRFHCLMPGTPTEVRELLYQG